MSWYDYIPQVAAFDAGTGSDGGGPLGSLFGFGGGDPANAARNQLTGNAGQANRFAGAGAANYQNANSGLNGVNTYLQGLARGQNSVSAEQLRQGLMQNQAAQQSMAAGAAPMNQAMAARNAANNMASLGYGMSGQQALAGQAERNAAMQQLGQNFTNQGQMGVNAALGGYGAANQGYGAAVQNPQKTAGSFLMGGLSGIGGMMSASGGAGGAAAMSDRNVKHDIAEDDDSARKLREGLKAYTYKYNDPKHGEGKRIGIMAQDLEKAGSKAVFQTREGKAVNGAVLSTENTAMIVELGKRLAAVEAKR